MAGLVPPHLLEQIRAANDIVDVIGYFLPLNRAGENFRALCPFHREKTPSFNVNPHHQIFKCFGCGKGGDVFTFVREYENLEFMDAVRRLAERASIPLEFESNPAAQQQKHIKEVLWNIHEQITQRWQAALANEAGGQVARDYLAKRGVSDEALKLFRLGAAPESWDDTVNWAKSKGHDLAVVEQAGLIIKKEDTDRYYDRFRGRLIFPICDEQSRVIGFSGRILSGDEKTAKYVNSPETPIFTKGKVFFGLDKSKRPLLDAESAVICEGQLDLIACYMAGVQNVVAPQGTALTPDHARILKRYVEEVVLCFDADNAGQNAATRSLDPLLAAGLAIRVASIPNGKDPDDFIKTNGGEAFREILDKAEGFFDWYLKRLSTTNDTKTDKGRVTVLREFGEALAKTRNAVLIDTHAQKAALRLGVSVDAVRAEFKKTRPPAESRNARDEDFDRLAGDADSVASAATEEIPSTPPTPREMQLLKLLLFNGDHRPVAASHLDANWLMNSTVKRIVQRCLKDIGEALPQGAAFLSEFHDDPAAQALIGTILADHHPIPEPEKQMADVLIHLRNDFLNAELQRLTRELTHPDVSDEHRLELLHRQKELRAERQRPLDEGT
ncbi:MAG TPA: DNA primase [Verrucomicrobiae bacterium]